MKLNKRRKTILKKIDIFYNFLYNNIAITLRTVAVKEESETEQFMVIDKIRLPLILNLRKVILCKRK